MGISNSKEDEGRELREKINELEDEVKEVKKRREKEALKYEHDLWLFGCKEEEWKQEMTKMKMTLEVALEKWKKLYHEIKLELDHLILHTLLQGEKCSQGDSECLVIEELQKELKAKEETVQALTSRLAAMENENIKKERDIDILRQSLKILGVGKNAEI
ncbi:Serine-tRNA synthetase type1 N-terminal protein [Dioscorea alata]|uniref:Serine-tRNA synthetase type1 N-terminal protein n=1 Tax=Dioscorea alata TaxID=55571 RepID=A0ACB7WSQ2_DIOAL|nr:Serine-tRNA synthetase type1 N-terminal protein [Dioscorea alata]